MPNHDVPSSYISTTCNTQPLKISEFRSLLHTYTKYHNLSLALFFNLTGIEDALNR
jgi:hypothetical protein